MKSVLDGHGTRPCQQESKQSKAKHRLRSRWMIDGKRIQRYLGVFYLLYWWQFRSWFLYRFPLSPLCLVFVAVVPLSSSGRVIDRLTDVLRYAPSLYVFIQFIGIPIHIYVCVRTYSCAWFVLCPSQGAKGESPILGVIMDSSYGVDLHKYQRHKAYTRCCVLLYLVFCDPAADIRQLVLHSYG